MFDQLSQAGWVQHLWQAKFLIHFHTSNVAENFMSVCTQLERGKSRNCTQAGHFWYIRAGMAVLRINEGPTWAPSTFRDALAGRNNLPKYLDPGRRSLKNFAGSPYCVPLQSF